MNAAAGTDNTLAYIDQASFLGLRTLGRGPLIQFTWIYEHPVDLDALRRFQADLGGGMLGRRIERSPLPFGRHRWVNWNPPPALDIDPVPAPRDAVPDWLDRRLALPIDPEFGPPWHLGLLPLAGGGAALSLLVSHTVGDGVGIGIAVAEAARGIIAGPTYPPAGSRRRGRALREDARQAARAMADVARAVVALRRMARENTREADSGPGRPPPRPPQAGEAVLTVPSATIYVDGSHWDQRAEILGGKSNSLFLALSARLGLLAGRASPDGTVLLAVPVNERAAGDRRGNAISGVDLVVDATAVTTDLGGVRRALKAALADFDRTRERLAAPLPLTPFVPRALARRLEGAVLGSAPVIGCSSLGEPDAAVNRPDGTDAEFFSVRSVDAPMTAAEVRRIGGLLFLVAARAHGRQSVSVCFADATASNTRAALVEMLRGLLTDFGIEGTVE